MDDATLITILPKVSREPLELMRELPEAVWQVIISFIDWDIGLLKTMCVIKPDITRFYLSTLQLKAAGAMVLGAALEQGAFKHLILLDMRANGLGDDGLRHLSGALEKGACLYVRTILFDKNFISSKGVTYFARAMEVHKGLYLEDLSFSQNSLREAGVKELMKIFTSGACRKLKSLDLRTCR